MKIHNRTELQQIAPNHSSDIGFRDFMKFYKDYNKRAIFISSEGYDFIIS